MPRSPVRGPRPKPASSSSWRGGEASAIQAVTPLLMALGSAVHTLGRSGTGRALKLAVNSLLATQVVARAEQLALLRDQQVDPVAALARLQAACEAGLGDEHLIAVHKLYA